MSVIATYGPLFISLNCMPPRIITKVVKKLRKLTDLPIGVYAQGDGGVDDVQGWTGGGVKAADSYLKEAQKWIKSGVQIIGGCCGTNPEYIKNLSAFVPGMRLNLTFLLLS
ncbi:MAG: homocysteine S-methyltransferase family protein [Patescibacteria group bacterium]|nr:homocysteine S-methyltransferase family protein [Patescibacteria group bacterium]